MNVLKGLKPENVFKYFEEISNIPRGSGDERRISDYLVKFANEHNLEVIQEECMNVIIRKPASKGYEDAPMVILQGHMDMVCEKNLDCDHDFSKDPIDLQVEGDFISANGTTLGADNGIAVAYALAILSDDTLEHPPIEALITSDEENGMTGVMELVPSDVKGKMLINLDSEEEGEFCVSCAGGINANFKIEPKYIDVDAKYDTFYNIQIRGLKGGHSGSDINKGRGNAHKLIARIMDKIDVDFALCDIKGGAKSNAIPRESDIVIAVNSKDKERVNQVVAEMDQIFKNELAASDSGVVVNILDVDALDKTYDESTQESIISLLTTVVNGVQTMSMSIENLVESSTSLGVIKMEEGKLTFICAIRSSVDSLKAYIVSQMEKTSKLTGIEFKVYADYPGWEYKKESELRDLCKDVYEKMYNKEPKIMAIHAGLECGFLREKLGDIDMISFGPNMFDVHTPDEKLSIQSAKRTYEFLLEVLKNIR